MSDFVPSSVAGSGLPDHPRIRPLTELAQSRLATVERMNATRHGPAGNYTASSIIYRAGNPVRQSDFLSDPIRTATAADNDFSSPSDLAPDVRNFQLDAGMPVPGNVNHAGANHFARQSRHQLPLTAPSLPTQAEKADQPVF